MDSYTRTVVNLKVIGQINDHERLTIDGGVYTIQRVPRGHFRRFWNWITRSFTTQSRDHMLMHMEFLIRDTELYAQKNPDRTITDALPGVVRGLQSLQRTYIQDVATTSALEFIEQRFTKLLELHGELSS